MANEPDFCPECNCYLGGDGWIKCRECGVAYVDSRIAWSDRPLLDDLGRRRPDRTT